MWNDPRVCVFLCVRVSLFSVCMIFNYNSRINATSDHRLDDILLLCHFNECHSCQTHDYKILAHRTCELKIALPGSSNVVCERLFRSLRSRHWPLVVFLSIDTRRRLYAMHSSIYTPQHNNRRMHVYGADANNA